MDGLIDGEKERQMRWEERKIERERASQRWIHRQKDRKTGKKREGEGDRDRGREIEIDSPRQRERMGERERYIYRYT